MRNYFIGILDSQNGIQRDGTAYASKKYVDGQWVRFYENQPKKIGGCVLTSLGTDTIIRSLLVIPRSPAGVFLYTGKSPPIPAGSVEYIEINIHGVASGAIDRTPLTWGGGSNIIWSLDSGNFLDAGSVSHTLIFANPHENDISDTTEYPVFAGKVSENVPLIPLLYSNGSPVVASGGVLVTPPVLVIYGTDGKIRWSKFTGDLSITDPSVWPIDNQLTVSNTKIVKAINTLGGNSPTILLWSLNGLYRASFVDNPDVLATEKKLFVSATIHSNISIMAPNSVVNYDQQIFWIGTDQFYVYNGIVQSLPNTTNNDWFFNSVNQEYRAKIWGVAVPRYKEIWWFYPRGESTECNAVIIYNLESNTYYDNTISPEAFPAVYPWTRSAGVSASGNYPFPIYADNTLVPNPVNPSSQTYPIWTHEQGVDRVIGTQHFAINSYYTTHLIDLWTQDGSNSNFIRNARIVPDFRQLGEMSVTISNFIYPHSIPTSEGPYNFTQSTEYVDFSSQGALVSFTFRSNIVGGDYFAGKVLYLYQKGDTLK